MAISIAVTTRRHISNRGSRSWPAHIQHVCITRACNRSSNRGCLAAVPCCATSLPSMFTRRRAGSTLRLELAWWGPPSGQRAYPLLLPPKLSHGHRARAHTRPWTCQHTRPTSIRPSPVTFCAGLGETMVVQLLRSGWSSSPACRTMCCRGAHARRQCHFQDGPQPATIPTPAACHLPIVARILDP